MTTIAPTFRRTITRWRGGTPRTVDQRTRIVLVGHSGRWVHEETGTVFKCSRGAWRSSDGYVAPGRNQCVGAWARAKWSHWVDV